MRRYRDENYENRPEFVRTSTVKRVMEVSKAMKPSVGILNLNQNIYDVAFLPKHNHIPSLFLASKEERTPLQSLSFVLDLQWESFFHIFLLRNL